MIRKAGLMILGIMMFVLTACSSTTSSDPKDDATKDDSKSETLRIGVLTPTTGSSAKQGEDMNNAIKMAVEEINAAGGVKGQQLELFYGDDACNPESGASAANKLVSQEVLAVVGGYCSGATLPATGVFHQADIPMVIAASNSATIPAQGYENLVLTNGTNVQQGEAAANYMLNSLGAQKIAIIHDNTAYTKDLAEITKKFVEDQGGEVVAYEAINPEETDFTGFLTKLKQEQPDATYFTGYYASGGLLIKQFRQLQVSGAIGVGDGSNDLTLVDLAGKENAEGVFVTTSPTPEFLPSAQSWVEQYNSKYNLNPGPYSALSYDAMRLLADAMERSTSLKGADIAKALRATDGFKTFAGPIAFKEDGTLKESNFIILNLKDGEFVLAE